MKTTKLQQLIASIAARSGVDPELPANAYDTAALVDYIQESLNYAWAFFDWPETNHTEERIVLGAGFAEGGYTYEADYQGTISYIGRAVEGSTFDQKVWRIKRVTTTAAGAVLNIDTALNVAWADRLAASYQEDSQNSAALEIPYVPLYAEGRTPIGQITAIYSENPQNRVAKELLYTLGDDNIYITDTGYHGGTVYVKFSQPIPELSLTAYEPLQQYSAGAVVYHQPTGDAYKAAFPTLGNVPTNTQYWVRQAIPFFLGDYIKASALSALMLEQGGMENKAAYLATRAEGYLMKAMDDAWLRRGQVRTYSARFQ